ncbi:gag protein [Lasius niger]|uniref:Gag protein n=1 Tax=Lasius niger TaxID=67767 RepID=A0A0J7JWK9_LASNI|nr:gag protein [Lasius niger]
MVLERDDERPGFWADLLVEVARLQTERRNTRQEEQSREGKEAAAPEGTEAAQEDPRDAEAEASPEPPQKAEEKAREETPIPTGSVERDDTLRVPARRVEPALRRPRPFPGEVMGNTSYGCWRCGGPDHFRRECPRRDDPCAVQICYRCGRLGTTVRNCPNCREGWLAQGPYVRGRGHAGPEPPRRRGLPPPMRMRENMQPPAWLG